MTEADPIQSALAEASGHADEVTARFAVQANAGDVVEVARSGVLLDRLLTDIHEALRQLFVAGLSYPDTELPDELGQALLDQGQLVGRLHRPRHVDEEGQVRRPAVEHAHLPALQANADEVTVGVQRARRPGEVGGEGIAAR